jgi:hypothetical protein
MHMGGFPTLAILVFICNDQGFPGRYWWKIVLRVGMSRWHNPDRTDMRRFIRLQAIALFFVIAFYSVYAFAASETAGHPTGGEGTSLISGWMVSNVHYQLGQDASKISAVEFDLDRAATQVQVSLNSSSAAFYSCVNVSGTHWFCNTFSQVGIAGADELRVIATGN